MKYFKLLPPMFGFPGERMIGDVKAEVVRRSRMGVKAPPTDALPQSGNRVSQTRECKLIARNDGDISGVFPEWISALKAHNAS